VKFSAFDHECMSLALRLAARGINSTHPNPRVGCVIARDHEFIASGWHVAAGGPHAEVHALQSAGSGARGATAFVNLEPCSHHGRTPPCTDALIAAGIKRVVVALQDPNTRVNGDGLRRLEAAGITVDIGLLAPEAEELNAGFLMRMRANRPWMRVKIATSLDGRTALPNGKSHWISSPESRQDVQSWRARSSAILTGVGTVLADDPEMTVRIKDAPRHPLRVIVDTRWRTPPRSRILQDRATALIAGGEGFAIPAALGDSGARCLGLPLTEGRVDLGALMHALAGEAVNEVQVEAGATLCGALLKAGLVDEVLLYQAPVLLGDGGPGPFNLGALESVQEGTHLEVLESCYLGRDARLRLRPRQVAT